MGSSGATTVEGIGTSLIRVIRDIRGRYSCGFVNRSTTAHRCVRQRIAVLVDGAVVHQCRYRGVARQIPHGAAVHGDIGGVARVVLHDAAVGAVVEDEVADGSAGAPLRVGHDVHQDAAGHGEGAAREGAGGGDAGGYLEERCRGVGHR